MPRGDKLSYTDKQKRQVEHIIKSDDQKGLSKPEAQRRAWTTENNRSGVGIRSGSGRAH